MSVISNSREYFTSSFRGTRGAHVLASMIVVVIVVGMRTVMVLVVTVSAALTVSTRVVVTDFVRVVVPGGSR
jgi:hypothetical protein